MDNPEQDADRAAFEKWYIKRYGGRKPDDTYSRDVEQREAWQAAKADSRATQDALEQVCANLEELESMNDTSFVNDDEYAYHRQWVTEALSLAAPFRKTGA